MKHLKLALVFLSLIILSGCATLKEPPLIARIEIYEDEVEFYSHGPVDMSFKEAKINSKTSSLLRDLAEATAIRELNRR